jgi:hypothetical protein
VEGTQELIVATKVTEALLPFTITGKRQMTDPPTSPQVAPEQET